jgi:hypothetical protein
VFLETTRATTQLVYAVDSVDDVRFKPELFDESIDRRDAFHGACAGVIEPAAAVPESDGRLVGGDGPIDASYEVLADDPLVIGL